MSGLVPEDVYELTWVADPRLDPAGGRVAYVQWWIDRDANEYRSNIWVAAVDGSTPPRRLTTGESRDMSPRWSPDSTRLAFTSSRRRGEDPEPGQLYALSLEGGEAIRLTDLKEDAADPTWSPDGERLAFSSRVRDEAYEEEDDRKRRPRRFTRLWYKLDNVGWTGDRRQHVFVVPADGSGEPEQLTDGDFEDSTPRWSPDGTRLVFISARDEDWDTELATDLYVLKLGGADPPTKLTSSTGNFESPVWSPDGSQIAALYTHGTFDWPYHGQVALVSAEGGELDILTGGLDRQCAPFPPVRDPVWQEDRITFPLEDHGNIHLYAVAADGSSEPTLLIGGEQVITGFDVAGEVVVHTASTHTDLADLFVGDRRLTTHGKSFTAARTLIEPERFTAVSDDGSEVDAWIVRPAGIEEGSRYPTLLSIHGGPYSQYHTGFFDEFQVLAGAGYAVVYANPRGSSGSTEAWARAIRGPAHGQGPGWGTVDYEDVMAAIDTAVDRYDFVDRDRLGVLGGSYGGFMTSWIVGHTDRFRAACSERAVNNLVSAFGSGDLFWVFAGQFGSSLYDDFDAWVERSPSTYAADIETPLLVMHSENDLRCAIEQAEHLFVSLRLAHKDVELVRFPAESHELSRSGSPAHRVMRFEVILEWFDRQLKADAVRTRTDELVR